MIDLVAFPVYQQGVEMPGGFYTYRDQKRRPSRERTEENSSVLDEINSLAGRLASLRERADTGDIASMMEANEVIRKITGLRVGLDRDGIRTRYDSDGKKFVFD